jgi:hypothetical protein
MKPESSPLVGKLTLLVLTLILGCLVLLVLRAYGPARSGVVTSENVAPSATTPDNTVANGAVEATDDVPSVIAPASPPRRPVTNATSLLRSRKSTNPEPARTVADTEIPSRTSDAPGLSTEPVVGAPVATGFEEPPPSAGTVLLSGVAILNGVPPREVEIDFGPSCGPLRPAPASTRHFVVSEQNGLANVVVYVKSGLARKYGPVQAPPVLDQVGCMYEPYVMSVVTGQRFQIRNSDPTLHNIHATPKANREFNIGQTQQGQVNEKSFDVPELFIRLKCDVHPWMFAYVTALDHPFVAVTDTNGAFQFPALLPPGTYVLGARHHKSGELEQVSFTFAVPPSVKPQGSVARSN